MINKIIISVGILAFTYFPLVQGKTIEYGEMDSNKLCSIKGNDLRAKKFSNAKLDLEIKKRGLRYTSENSDPIKRTLNIGATECEVLASQGKPIRVNRTVNKYGESKQLIYGRNYIYLEEGLVTSWSD